MSRREAEAKTRVQTLQYPIFDSVVDLTISEVTGISTADSLLFLSLLSSIEARVPYTRSLKLRVEATVTSSLLEVERSSKSRSSGTEEVKKLVITSSVSLSNLRDSGLRLRNSSTSLASTRSSRPSRSPSSQGGDGGPLFRAVVMAKSVELLADNRGSAEVKKSEPVMTHQDESESES